MDRHPYPDYSLGERRVDAAVHCVGIVGGTVAAIWVMAGLRAGTDGATIASMAVYVTAMVVMLTASGAYNMAPPGRLKERLRRVDHAAIFAAIAGTYTPLLALRLPSPWGMAACAAVWAVALGGMALKLLAPRRRERLGLALYLGLGWIGLPAMPVVARALDERTLALIGAGALIYTVGAGIHLLERLPYHNALWHIFVLAAAACHFFGLAGEFAAM